MSKQLSIFRELAALCDDSYWKDLLEQCAKHQFPARVRLTKGCLERQTPSKKRILLPLPRVASLSELERCKEFFSPDFVITESSDSTSLVRPPLIKEFDQGHLRNFYLHTFVYSWYEEYHKCTLTTAQKDQFLDRIVVGWFFGIITKHHLVIDMVSVTDEEGETREEERLVDISNVHRDVNGWFYVENQPTKRPSVRSRERQSSIRCSMFRGSVL